MKFSIEELPNMPEAISILRGPILQAAKTNSDNMHGLIADDGRWSHIASGPLVSIFDSPFIVVDKQNIISKLNSLKPIEAKSLNYSMTDLFTKENGLLQIYIDNTQIASEKLYGKWNKTEFFNVEYKIPSKLLKAKKSVIVRFVTGEESKPVNIYQVKLLKR